MNLVDQLTLFKPGFLPLTPLYCQPRIFTYLVGFQLEMLILAQYDMVFHAMVVIGLIFSIYIFAQ